MAGHSLVIAHSEHVAGVVADELLGYGVFVPCAGQAIVHALIGAKHSASGGSALRSFAQAQQCRLYDVPHGVQCLVCSAVVHCDSMKLPGPKLAGAVRVFQR